MIKKSQLKIQLRFFIKKTAPGNNPKAEFFYYSLTPPSATPSTIVRESKQ